MKNRGMWRRNGHPHADLDLAAAAVDGVADNERIGAPSDSATPGAPSVSVLAPMQVPLLAVSQPLMLQSEFAPHARLASRLQCPATPNSSPGPRPLKCSA